MHHRSRGIGHTAMHWAGFMGETRSIEWLVARGADVNARNTCQATPLHTAASKGQAAAVALLLDHGADPSLTNDDGETPGQLAPFGVQARARRRRETT